MNLFKFLLIGFVVLACFGLASADVYVTYDDFGSAYRSSFWSGSPTIADLGDGTSNLSAGSLVSTYVNRSTYFNVTWNIQWVNLTTDGYNSQIEVSDNAGNPMTYFKIFTYADATGDGYVQAYCSNSSGGGDFIEGLAGIYLGENDWLNEWHNITLVWDNDTKVEWWVDDTFKGGCNATSNELNIPDPISTDAMEIRVGFGHPVQVDIYLDWIKVDRPFAYESAIIAPGNTTYITPNVNLTWATNSSLQKPAYDCTVTIDGAVNDTYTDVINNTAKTITMPGFSNGAHNVSVNCYDGFENSTDTEYFTVSHELNLEVLSPTNSTYTTTALTATYLANSSSSATINCTVSFDGDYNDTYTDVNNTQRSFDFTQLIEGYHNVSVTCDDDSGTNATSTVVYTFSAELELSISNPINTTYMDSDLTLTYLPNTTFSLASNINCTVRFDEVINTTYTDLNNTARSFDFTQTIPTFHNVSVNCYDGNENLTRTIHYTVDDINFTLAQNATAYEGVTNFYNVTIGMNLDIISDVNASLYWNDTFIGINNIANISPSSKWANMTFMIPIITTNNTSINTKWNVTKLYINGSSYVENSSTSVQACWYSWDWDATTYSYNLLEGSLNDISVNLTKLGGVGDPVNTTISALLVWNGSPSTMTATMNTSALIGYSNTTRLPRIPINYNWTFGFNVTLNYSINHGILGYHSRSDTNTTYNYTQTVHKLMFTNCTTGIEALRLRFFDEFNPSVPVNSSVDAYLEILLDDGTNRTHGFEFTNNETFRICIEPYFGSFRANSEFTYGGASIDANYTYREYYLVNASINNVSNNIDLHTLATANGTALTFSVVDEFGTEIEGVVIKALRWYPLLTGYKTVNMGKTNFDGEAVLNLKFYDTYYKFLFEQNGTVVKEVSKLIIYSTPLSVSIAEILDTYYTILDNVAYNYSSTNVSDVITWAITVTDTSGLMSSVNLKCVKKSLLGDTVINDTTITGSAVTVYCVLGNYSNNVFYVTATGTFSDYGTLTIYSETFDWREPYAYGVTGLFASFMIIGSLMFIGLWNPGASIILGIIGLVLTNALGLLDLAISNVIGLIIVGVVIILMRRRNS